MTAVEFGVVIASWIPAFVFLANAVIISRAGRKG